MSRGGQKSRGIMSDFGLPVGFSIKFPWGKLARNIRINPSFLPPNFFSFLPCCLLDVKMQTKVAKMIIPCLDTALQCCSSAPCSSCEQDIIVLEQGLEETMIQVLHDGIHDVNYQQWR